MLLEVGDEVVLPRLAEDHPIQRDLLSDTAQAFGVLAEWQGGHVALDSRGAGLQQAI